MAAFRFGHSMIRPVYRLNTTIERRPIFAPDRGAGAHVDDAADLGGFRPIPADWAIDWQFFIDLGPGAGPRAMGPLYDPIARKPQHAYKIDYLPGEPAAPTCPAASPPTRRSSRFATSNADGPSSYRPGRRWPRRSVSR